MTAYRKASIRDLTKAAYALHGHFLEGKLHQDNEGHWKVGNTPLEEWLARYEHEEVTLIVVSMEADRPIEPKICRTCGRRYIDVECPHCREVRNRLRGRSRE